MAPAAKANCNAPWIWGMLDVTVLHSLDPISNYNQPKGRKPRNLRKMGQNPMYMNIHNHVAQVQPM